MLMNQGVPAVVYHEETCCAKLPFATIFAKLYIFSKKMLKSFTARAFGVVYYFELLSRAPIEGRIHSKIWIHHLVMICLLINLL